MNTHRFFWLCRIPLNAHHMLITKDFFVWNCKLNYQNECEKLKTLLTPTKFMFMVLTTIFGAIKNGQIQVSKDYNLKLRYIGNMNRKTCNCFGIRIRHWCLRLYILSYVRGVSCNVFIFCTFRTIRKSLDLIFTRLSWNFMLNGLFEMLCFR